MNYLSLTPDVTSNILLLMRGTGNFVEKRIPHKKNKLAYIKAMRECIVLLKDAATLSDLQSSIISWKSYRDVLYKKKNIFDNSEEEQYHSMACDHAMEAAQSIFARFVTGAGDDGPRIARTIIIYDGTEVF